MSKTKTYTVGDYREFLVNRSVEQQAFEMLNFQMNVRILALLEKKEEEDIRREWKKVYRRLLERLPEKLG